MPFSRIVLALFIIVSLAVITSRGMENPRPVFIRKVLSHFSSPADSLKRTAARFLADNMEGHSYQTYDLVDTNQTVIKFNVLDYENYDSLVASFDRMEKLHGTLDFKKRDEFWDDSLLSAEFLIAHIDGAFMAWKSRPWAKGLSFDQFCEYILPYRGSNEPLELWQSGFNQRYDSSFQKMKNPGDPIEAASIINQDLMTWFHFDPRFYYHPTDQSYSEMKTTKLGRCEDMTNLTIFAMRANGLAVTSDYTPYWANSGNNHAWNAIVTSDGKVTPFMGAEANPGKYSLANKLAKVYRKTYSIQRDNLAFQLSDKDKLPPYLSSKSYVDVTKSYTAVRTLTLKIDAPDSVKFAYLCVFNSGEWKAIQWSKISGDSATFTDMGVGIAYLPGLYKEKKIIPAGLPFILTSDGEMQTLKADTNKATTLRLTSTTRIKQEPSTDGITKTNLTPGVSYELHYWQNGWQTAGTAVADSGPLLFAKVPDGDFYWLTAADSDQEERIFTYENDTQVWW